MWHNAPVTLLGRLNRAVASLRTTVYPIRAKLFAILLAGAVLVNVIQFPGIESQPYKEMRAFGQYDTADLTVIGYRECDWCRQRYGLFLSLGTVAPGARVIIPTPSLVMARSEGDEVPARLRVFGRASSVELVDYNASSVLVGVDPSPYIISSGEGGDRGAPWALAVDPRYLPPGGVPDPDNYLLDIDVLTGEGPTRSDTVREFVLVRWWQARTQPIHRSTYQELLIETSLLPADVRKDLTG
jgi:hypothetical protein